MDELNKQRRRFISINDSACLYGIAILLMVFHHCFCIPSRLGENYISVLGDYALEARIAWIGKLCVAIFAFISGYAFSIKAEKNKEEHVINRVLSDYRLSISHLIKFYLKFWLVFLIFIPIGIAFFGKSGNPKNLAQGLILGRGGTAASGGILHII